MKYQIVKKFINDEKQLQQKYFLKNQKPLSRHLKSLQNLLKPLKPSIKASRKAFSATWNFFKDLWHILEIYQNHLPNPSRNTLSNNFKTFETFKIFLKIINTMKTSEELD